jgi:hypothetical protein
MKRMLLVTLWVVLSAVSSAMAADAVVLVTARPTAPGFTAYWVQLGVPGTQVIGPFSLTAGTLAIMGTDSSAAVIEQEGNPSPGDGFLGDFAKGDYVIETLYNGGVLKLTFSTGVSQAGAQFQPCVGCNPTARITAIFCDRQPPQF